MFLLSTVLLSQAQACANSEWDQCGGNDHAGATCCPSGVTCQANSEWYSQCRQNCPSGWACDSGPAPAPPSPTPPSPSPPCDSPVAQWGQCGGNDYAGETCCQAGLSCYEKSSWYSQCLTECPNDPNWACAQLPTPNPAPTPEPTPESPGPGPSPSPGPGPSPSPGPGPNVETPVIGYYSWSWTSGSQGPPNANAGVAFTGWTDVDDSLADWDWAGASNPPLVGAKYLDLGGGTYPGRFTAADLQNIATSESANKIKNAGFEGVMFDVEKTEGSSNTLVPLFQAAFATMKAAGLLVAVTTSHSAPYECDSPQVAIDLVKAWVADANIDIISPQLYSSGYEVAPEFAETWSCASAGCTWELYKDSIPIIAPSIVGVSHYQASQDFFQQHGITLGGYFVWEQL